MMRVEHELASLARRRLPQITLCFYDPRENAYRPLQPEWAGRIIGWQGAIATAALDERQSRRRLLPSRYPIVMALERRRLTARSARTARWMDRLQRLVLAPRAHQFPLADKAGNRLALVPPDLALGSAMLLGPGDIVLSASSDWLYRDITALGRIKRQRGFRLCVICNDIIPLSHPEFFSAADVAVFKTFWDAMFPLADRVLAISRQTESDVLEYCAGSGLRPGATAVIPMGYRAGDDLSAAPLRPGLEPGRYALFVSTIEPRKNHALLLRVWRRLLAEGVPQRRRFQLVFVGRPGWMVQRLLAEIADTAAFQGTLLHLADVEDAELSTLYAQAAFCLYPSLYEGFGLPVIEAFARGRPVIASTGGALPEAVGGLSPCLDPGDDEAWLAAIRRWIEQPRVLSEAEARVRAGFARPDWEIAGIRIFEAAGFFSAASAASGHAAGAGLGGS